MKTLIIEDDPIELENLKILLESFEDSELIGAVETIQEGIAMANAERPDLILLDIQLGSEISLNLLHLLQYNPYIICTTLHTEYAIQAFEVGISDYLTKPLNEAKLKRALERYHRLTHLRTQQQQGNPDTSQPESYSIPLSHGNTTQVVPFSSILSIICDDEYTVVQNDKNRTFCCTRSMREWAALLPVSLFTSLDRSLIINQQLVESFTKLNPQRVATITFRNGSTHPIGATALKRLKAVLA